MRSEDLVARSIRGVGWLLQVVGALFALFVLGVQTYDYLKLGIWAPVGTLDFLASFTQWGWIHMPTDWVGLHESLNYVNAGICGLIFALVVGEFLKHFESQ